MIVGCYSLHLYCDHPRHPTMLDAAKAGQATWELYGRLNPGEYSGPNERYCKMRARKFGWRFRAGNDGMWVAICPKCAAGKFLTP